MKEYKRPIKRIVCYKCGGHYYSIKNRKRHVLGLIGPNCYPRYRKLGSFGKRIYRNRKTLFEKWYRHLTLNKVDFKIRRLYKKVFCTPLNRSGWNCYFCPYDWEYCNSKQKLIEHYGKKHRKPYQSHKKVRQYLIKIGAQERNEVQRLNHARKQNRISARLYKRLVGMARRKLCLYCENTTHIRSSNMKRHVETQHPEVKINKQRRLLAVPLPPPLIGAENYQYESNLYILLLAIYQILLVKWQKPITQLQMFKLAFEWRKKVSLMQKTWAQTQWLKMINACNGFWAYNQPNTIWEFVSVKKTPLLDRCYLAKNSYPPFVRDYDDSFIQFRLRHNREFDASRRQEAQWKQLRAAFKKNQILQRQQALQAAEINEMQAQQKQLLWMQEQQKKQQQKNIREDKKNEEKAKKLLAQLKQKTNYDQVRDYKLEHGITQVVEIVTPRVPPPPPRQRGRPRKGKSTGRPKKETEMPQQHEPQQ